MPRVDGLQQEPVSESKGLRQAALPWGSQTNAEWFRSLSFVLLLVSVSMKRHTAVVAQDSRREGPVALFQDQDISCRSKLLD